jgi:hypothetical protein
MINYSFTLLLHNVHMYIFIQCTSNVHWAFCSVNNCKKQFVSNFLCCLLANPVTNKIIRLSVFNYLFSFILSYLLFSLSFSILIFRCFFVLFFFFIQFFPSLYSILSFFVRKTFYSYLLLQNKQLASYVCGWSDQCMHVNNFPSTQPCPFSQDCSLF